MWVQPNALAAHLFAFFILKPIRATTSSFFQLKRVEPGSVFLREQKGGVLVAVGSSFLEQ